MCWLCRAARRCARCLAGSLTCRAVRLWGGTCAIFHKSTSWLPWWRRTGGVAFSSSCQHLRRVPYPSSLRRSRSLGRGSIRPPLMPKAVFDVYVGGGRLALYMQGCATEVSTCVEVVVTEFDILNVSTRWRWSDWALVACH